YYEAGFEPMAGRRAVAQVVLNRMRHKAFPKSVCGVVYQGHTRPGCQFSFTCDGSLRRRPDPQAWLQAQSVARAALEGYVETSVGLATHYHANYVMPYWAPRLAKLTQIGAHIFYRWHGGWGRPAAYAGHYAGVESIPSAPLRGVAPARAGETMLASVAPAHPGETYRDSPTASFNPDVGGRLNVETGWKLKIAEPAETRSRAADVIRRQSGVASLLEEAAGEAP
ncbi:MAG: cell wall hydrolase, partial [Cypionkella sp.]